MNNKEKNIVLLGLTGCGKTTVGKMLAQKINYDELAKLNGYLLVNSTPVGMYPKVGVSAVGDEIIEKFQAVVDIVYNPTETEILRKARSLGKISIGGLYMLVGQAVKAEEIFHQVEIDKEIINVIYNELKKEF